MKKIKRLELRTGQVLNPLQQGFVVGGHDSCTHEWVDGDCNCTAVGSTHDVSCTKTVDGFFISVDGSSLILSAAEIAAGALLERFTKGKSGTGFIKDGFDRGRSSIIMKSVTVTHCAKRRCNGIGTDFKTHDEGICGRWDRIDYN